MTTPADEIILFILRGIVVAFSIIRLHATPVHSSAFVLYLSILIGIGRLFAGDLDSMWFNIMPKLDEIDSRIWANSWFAFGLGYMVIRGSTRHEDERRLEADVSNAIKGCRKKKAA